MDKLWLNSISCTKLHIYLWNIIGQKKFRHIFILIFFDTLACQPKLFLSPDISFFIAFIANKLLECYSLTLNPYKTILVKSKLIDFKIHQFESDREYYLSIELFRIRTISKNKFNFMIWSSNCLLTMLNHYGLVIILNREKY